MRIADVQLRAYRHQRDEPLKNGLLSYPDSVTCVLEIVTDCGLSGVGLSVGIMWRGGDAVFESTAAMYRDLLIGIDPLRTGLAHELLSVPKFVGRRGVETRVLSMVDIALWDIKAQHSGLPLHVLLGGTVDSVDCYVAGGYYYESERDHAQLIAEMTEYVHDGARAIKMKIGRLPVTKDLARVQAVRTSVGPDVKLMVDANGAYSRHEALRVLPGLAECDVYWLEEPVPVDDLDSMAALAGGPVPIASGENEATLAGFRDLLFRGRAPIVNPDAEIMGGVTTFCKVAALAEATGATIAPHGRHELHSQLLAATTAGLMVEYYRGNVDPLVDSLLPERPRLEGGRIQLQDTPGHGMVLDEEAVSGARVL